MCFAKHLSSAFTGIALILSAPAVIGQVDESVQKMQNGQRDACINATGDPGCGTGSQRPTAPVVLLYAAIAVSPTTYRAGVSYGSRSSVAAQNESVVSCEQNNGGEDCKSIQWTQNGCIGIAISRLDKRYGYSGAHSSRLEAWNESFL